MSDTEDFVEDPLRNEVLQRFVPMTSPSTTSTTSSFRFQDLTTELRMEVYRKHFNVYYAGGDLEAIVDICRHLVLSIDSVWSILALGYMHNRGRLRLRLLRLSPGLLLRRLRTR
jgi:hypothetical protein